MKWSINFGRIFGIRFRIHLTFLMLVALFGFVGAGAYGPIGALSAMLFVCAVFVCVTVHELAHSLVARSFGVPVESITLLPIGGVAAMRGLPDGPYEEILISAAGPAVSIAIFAVMAVPLHVTVNEIWPPDPFTIHPRHFMVSLASVNLVLGLFNLIPAFPMDGGRLLRGLLALLAGFERATRVATLIGQVFGITLIVVGFFVFGSLWLPLIGFFIYLGASAEQRQLRIRSLLKRIRVSQVMVSSFRVIEPSLAIGWAAQMLLHGVQEDFPVVDGQRLLGIVPAVTVAEALQREQFEVPVVEVLAADLPTVTPETDLDTVQQKMLLGKHTVLPVTSGGHLVGMVSQNHISRFLNAHRVVA